MQPVTVLVQALSLLAFGFYGALTLLSRDMAAEFERYGLGRLRVFIASFQIVGSLGLLAGFYSRPLLLVSALGFTTMMLLALLVRVRIRDPLVAMIPAFVLMCLNLYLVLRAIA
ncbi:hypothetical protein BH11GEM2_BH11GEM2_28080 [soil metagenome]